MALTAPKLEELDSLLEMLIGESVNLESQSTSAAVDKLSLPHASILIDDEGQPVGAVVADLTATVQLGGMLMMMPQPGLEDQIDESDPSNTVVEAFSEVVNNLTVSLNAITGNPHVRSTPVERLDSLLAKGETDWLKSSATTAEFVGAFPSGKGILQIASK